MNIILITITNHITTTLEHVFFETWSSWCPLWHFSAHAPHTPPPSCKPAKNKQKQKGQTMFLFFFVFGVAHLDRKSTESISGPQSACPRPPVCTHREQHNAVMFVCLVIITNTTQHNSFHLCWREGPSDGSDRRRDWRSSSGRRGLQNTNNRRKLKSSILANSDNQTNNKPYTQNNQNKQTQNTLSTTNKPSNENNKNTKQFFLFFTSIVSTIHCEQPSSVAPCPADSTACSDLGQATLTQKREGKNYINLFREKPISIKSRISASSRPLKRGGGAGCCFQTN
jgi:hypothetical protein